MAAPAEKDASVAKTIHFSSCIFPITSWSSVLFFVRGKRNSCNISNFRGCDFFVWLYSFRFFNFGRFRKFWAEGEEQWEPGPTWDGLQRVAPCFISFCLGQEKSGPEGSFPGSPVKGLSHWICLDQHSFFQFWPSFQGWCNFQDQMHLKIGRMGSNICSLKFMFPHAVSNVVYKFNSPFFGWLPLWWKLLHGWNLAFTS